MKIQIKKLRGGGWVGVGWGSGYGGGRGEEEGGG